MDKFEYKKELFNSLDYSMDNLVKRLNNEGLDGWEVVYLTYDGLLAKVIFKRKISK